jgi:ribosomal protein S25
MSKLLSPVFFIYNESATFSSTEEFFKKISVFLDKMSGITPEFVSSKLNIPVLIAKIKLQVILSI